MHVTQFYLTEPAGPKTTPNRMYVVFLAGVAGISGFLFGFDTAVINGVLLFLRKEFRLTDMQTEIAASSLLLGCLVGAAGASLLGDRWGRKKSLLISAFLFTISTFGAALSPNVELFSVARLIGGLAIGLASSLPPSISQKFHQLVVEARSSPSINSPS